MHHSLLKRIDVPFYREALGLALPIAFQNLLTSCGTLIDTAMVVGLGNAETSAMGVAARFTFLLNIICFGISSGCAALLSQYWGARDVDNTRRSLGLALTLSLLFGLLYMSALLLFPEQLLRIFNDDPAIIALAADYMRIFSWGIPFLVFSQITCVAFRAVKNVYLPLISSTISVVVNTSLNYCLINGHFGFPRMELRGAALATAIGCGVQAAILLTALLFTKNPFRAAPRKLFGFDRSFVRKYIKIASPVLLNETMWGIGTNVYAMVLARQGTENHAGYTLYENLQQLFFVFFVGICGACSIMVGMRIGRGDHEGGYLAAKRFAVMTPVIGVLLGAVLILVRDPLLSLFPVETEAARLVASQCMLFYGFWIAMRMIPYTMICGIFRAGGDTKAGCILDLLGLYGFGIPAVLIVGLIIRPTLFVWLIATMFIAEDTVKGILCVRHFRSRKWIKQLTRQEKAPAPAPINE